MPTPLDIIAQLTEAGIEVTDELEEALDVAIESTGDRVDVNMSIDMSSVLMASIGDLPDHLFKGTKGVFLLSFYTQLGEHLTDHKNEALH